MEKTASNQKSAKKLIKSKADQTQFIKGSLLEKDQVTDPLKSDRNQIEDTKIQESQT